MKLSFGGASSLFCCIMALAIGSGFGVRADEPTRENTTIRALRCEHLEARCQVALPPDGANYHDGDQIEVSGTVKWDAGTPPPKRVFLRLWGGAPSRVPSSGSTLAKVIAQREEAGGGSLQWTGRIRARWTGSDYCYLEVTALDVRNEPVVARTAIVLISRCH
jgi:hypothetical protein